ncbi:hypothetical protein [Aedoeadaptatus coli]|uniref:hypothetical protein n=1 Tax=Aedoeadaptatus coli TaxID=2058292 RepID=UPI000D55D3A7|nr:hypothetical protein [Peptoniphilus coli]
MGIGIVSDLLNKSGKSKIDRRLQVAAARKEADALEAMLAKKADVAQYVIHESLVAKLKWDKIDLVFPLVEDGDAAKGLASMLTSEGIPFVGAGVMGLGIAEDPVLAAAILKQQGMDFRPVHAAKSVVDLAQIELTYPVIVTAKGEESVFVADEEALYEEAKQFLDVAPIIYLREPSRGKKVHVALIGNGDDVSVFTKAVGGELSKKEEDLVRNTAKKAFELFQLKDMGFFVMEADGEKAYVIDVRASADFRAESDFMAVLNEKGFRPESAVDAIVNAAIARTGAEVKPKSDAFLATAATRKNDIDILLKEEQSRLTEEKIGRFREETKEMRRNVEEGAEKMEAGAEEAAREAKGRLRQVERGARETWSKAKRYAKERVDEAQRDARIAQDVMTETMDDEDIRELKLRYAALEQRVYALEERIRFLENR